MRLIEWNCQGAFRKKYEKILLLKPDILVVPECESKIKLMKDKQFPKPNDFFWYGDTENKGIGIFSYSDYYFELISIFNIKYKHIIPLKVFNNKHSFILFAIWAKSDKENRENSYIIQIWLALNYYTSLLKLPCILVGDFNSNTIWDKKRRIGNHSDVVKLLALENIKSLYHMQESINQGFEEKPTFFMYRKVEKPYHIDYCFVSESIYNEGYSLSIGNSSDWICLSDHVPLVIDLMITTTLVGFDNRFSSLLGKLVACFDDQLILKFNEYIEHLIHNSRLIDSYQSSLVSKDIIGKVEVLIQINSLIKKL